MIDPGLKDRTVLITGANHGIGAATALRFAAQGANVFVSFFREHPRFSEAEFKEARSRKIGGSLLYEAMRQQSGSPIATRIRDADGKSAVWEPTYLIRSGILRSSTDAKRNSALSTSL